MSDQTPSYVVPQGSSQDKQRITVGGGGAAWHSQQRQQHQTQTNFRVGQQQQPNNFPNSNAQSPRAGESMVTGPLPGASGYAQGVLQIPVSSGGSSQGSSVTAMQVQAAPQSSGKAPSIVVVQGKSRTTCNFCMQRKKRCDYEEINGQKQPCRWGCRVGRACVRRNAGCFCFGVGGRGGYKCTRKVPSCENCRLLAFYKYAVCCISMSREGSFCFVQRLLGSTW